jgi:hypothetical protein
MDLEELLRELLADLAAIAEQHEEINDTPVEEAMTEAIFNGFLKPKPNFSLSSKFGMYSRKADAQVKTALSRYLKRATPLATSLGLNFHGRLEAFQNLSVTYGDAQLGYNDFFRYYPKEKYDAHGNAK